MIEVFRDPFWQFIGALSALVAIVIAIVIFLKERAKKAVTFQIISFLPFLTISEEEKGDFRVLYKGREVRDLFLVSLQVTNTGNVPITFNDYEKPISFIFGESSRIFSAEVVNTQPKTLPHELSIEGNRVTLSPILLNSGDTIEIKCLVTSLKKNTIVAGGRIVGVKEIVEKRVNTYRYFGWVVIGTFIMLIASIGIFTTIPTFDFRKILSDWSFQHLTFIVLFSIGVVISYGGMIIYFFRQGNFRGLLKFLWHSFSSVFSKD